MTFYSGFYLIFMKSTSRHRDSRYKVEGGGAGKGSGGQYSISASILTSIILTNAGNVLLSGRTRGEVGGAGKGSRGQNNQPPY